jgi:hypothetical protein
MCNGWEPSCSDQYFRMIGSKRQEIELWRYH